MRFLIPAVCVTFVRFLAVPLALSQTVQAPGFRISDQVELVVLEAAVHDRQRKWVGGLQKGQFKVSENGRPREITHFSSIDVPVTIGLVVDNSGSMLAKRHETVTSGLAFARESNPQDQFFVINFNDFVVSGLPESTPFTDDWQLLRKALFLGKPQGQTALYDAVAYSIQYLAASAQERRTLIVVSDGSDNVSHTSLAKLLDVVEASRATIYTIGLYDANSNDRNPGVLRKIARISGGEFFEPKQLPDILPVFHQISTEIRHRYTIGYVPAPSGPNREIRSVKVSAEAGGRKLNVRTRTSYATLAFDNVKAASAASSGAGKSN